MLFLHSVLLLLFLFLVFFSVVLQLIKIDVFVRTTSLYSSYYLFRLEKDLDGYLIMIRDYTYHFMDTSSP